MLLIKLNKVLIKEGFKTELKRVYKAHSDNALFPELFNTNTIFIDNLKIDDNLVVYTKNKKINLWDMTSYNPMTIKNLLDSINDLSEEDRIIVKKIIAILERDFKAYMKEIIEFNNALYVKLKNKGE